MSPAFKKKKKTEKNNVNEINHCVTKPTVFLGLLGFIRRISLFYVTIRAQTDPSFTGIVKVTFSTLLNELTNLS